MKGIGMHWQVLIGLVGGAGFAWMSIVFGWNEFTLGYLLPLGQIFVNLLKMIAVPLVLFSIVGGVASLGDVRKLGRLGGKTLGLYFLTTLLAIGTGIGVVNLFAPGSRSDAELLSDNRLRYELWRDASGVPPVDGIRKVEDPALAERIATLRTEEGVSDPWLADKLAKASQATEQAPLQPLVDLVPSNIFEALADVQMLQIIFFAIFFGAIVTGLSESRKKVVLDTFDALNEVFIRMVHAVMKGMPVFVFALMAGQIVKSAGTDPDMFLELLGFLLRYGAVVVLGLAIFLFIVYPSLVALFTKEVSYRGFLRSMRDAQLTAFSTSSSMATLPVTMECVHEKLGVSRRVSSFVLPIGATVNMDGTSLYQGVAVIALAQFHGIDLTWAQQSGILLTATAASIGAAAVPSAGLVMLIMVLESVGLNPAWIALIFPIDRILDMCRTAVNVTGDAVVACIVSSGEGELHPKTQ
ncbi:MAG: dicarboxylate/amino acid:cation symporter [Flavobacteriales bacterium]